MDKQELIRTAITALGANKPRTALTMLGIVIGIASVITMLAIGNGSQASIQASVQSLGSNTLTITAGSQQQGLVRGAAGSSSTLTNEDTEAFRDSSKISNVVYVSPETSRNFQVVGGGNNTNTNVYGVTADYAPVHNYEVETGEFISADHQDSQSRVAVIGPDTANDLFGTTEVVGETIRVDKLTLKIIGVTKSKGSSGFNNSDDLILVPLSTGQKLLFGSSTVRTIVLQATSADTLTQLQADASDLLLNRHDISDPADADFTIRNSAEILSTLTSVTSTFTALLASIASISLIVGGIGIMNIMIVTVTERTREIGLRKAIGATKEEIRAQFLTEAVMLTGLGGLIGVLIGVGISVILNSLGAVTTQVSLISIALSVSVSVLVGVGFGLYPAIKASNLNPIEALRFE